MAGEWKNELYFGDNLHVLREHIPDESVDLIYLDPPFNSQATYNVLFEEKTGEKSAAQITAFEDTWHWGIESELAFREVVTSGPRRLADLLQALRAFLGQNDMMAYLTMMAIRLVELHRVLKPTGSIYLHCDPTASHYLKLIMDAIFGADHFRNEIIWVRSLPHGNVRQMFGRSHDVILFYVKGDEPTWNQQFWPPKREYVERFFRYVEPETGRRYRLVSLINPNPNRPNLTYEWNGHVKVWKWTRERMQRAHDQGLLVYSRSGIPSYKQYLDETKGTPIQDVWTDIPPLMGISKERMGYQTQKPEALLERIIKASSNEGDLVLDPFCGCGTTIAVAERLKRRWIGIDITYLAINLIRRRLHDAFGSDLAPYQVIGIPVDLAGAKALAQENRHQFEWWALDLIGARPANDNRRKGADAGVDGYIYFFDDDSGKPKKIVVQVKSGHVSVNQVRDLKGVMERERAVIGAFVTLQRPTRPMLREAAAAGFYEPEYYPGQRFPRLQILTVEELLNGKELQYPRTGVPATYKQAERQRKGEEPEQQRIL